MSHDFRIKLVFWSFCWRKKKRVRVGLNSHCVELVRSPRAQVDPANFAAFYDSFPSPYTKVDNRLFRFVRPSFRLVFFSPISLVHPTILFLSTLLLRYLLTYTISFSSKPKTLLILHLPPLTYIPTVYNTPSVKYFFFLSFWQSQPLLSSFVLLRSATLSLCPYITKTILPQDKKKTFKFVHPVTRFAKLKHSSTNSRENPKLHFYWRSDSPYQT